MFLCWITHRWREADCEGLDSMFTVCIRCGKQRLSEYELLAIVGVAPPPASPPVTAPPPKDKD